MKDTIVTVRPGDKIRLRDVDPNATGGWTKIEAIEQLGLLRERLKLVQAKLYAEHRHGVLIIFQAMDTGGKDGATKSLCSGIDPAGVRVISFKVPNQDELDHDFLWRVHRVTPPKGMIGVWNRSHYEDVLVVRVHKLIEKKVWESRYEDIVAFEKILTRNHLTLIKIFLHISKDEQKKRLQSRLDNAEKMWKFHPSDLADRERWDEFQAAYDDVINRCTIPAAPWHIVPANKKWARNLLVMQLVVEALEELNPQYPRPDFDPKTIVID